jgi:hypothetical protein
MMKSNPNADTLSWRYRAHLWKDIELIGFGVIATIICTAITLLRIIERQAVLRAVAAS